MDSFIRQILDFERPPCSDLRQHLSGQAAAFIQLCDNNEARMRQITEELQDVVSAVNKLQNKVFVSLGLCLLCVSFKDGGGVSLFNTNW